MGNRGIGLTSRISTAQWYCDHRTASAGKLLRGITPARQSRAIAPEEDDTDPAAQGSKGGCCEIHNCRVPPRREVLEIFEDARVQPEPADDPDGAAVQSIARRRDRRRPGIGDDVLDLARKIGSHCLYFFRRRQRQHREKKHANPCQDTEGRSDKAGGHCSGLVILADLASSASAGAAY